MARLAIAKGFLAEYAKLDMDTRRTVEALVTEFAARPHAWRYLEKPRQSLDDRIRLFRVNSLWRGVVVAPDTGDTYCLVTILPHDKAYAYAAGHRFGVHQALGVLEARDEEAGPPPEQVDPGDLVAMEGRPGQVTFVSEQQELPLILAHPFTAWRTFLHPSQREIAYRPSYAGPAQVTGGPGTGKTITLLHRAAFLAARAAASPILLTTFNGNLAEALQAQLGLLVRDAAVRSRIEVLNVDRLAYGVVRQARGTPVIADERVLRDRWARAIAAAGLAFSPAFGKNEWEQVILAQDLRTEQAYLTCPRTGRGRPLTRPSAASSGRPRSGSPPGWPPPVSPRTCSWPMRPPGCSGRRRGRATGTSWWTRRRTCTRRSGGCSARRSRRARMTCSSRPTRTSASMTTGCRWPAWGSACGGGAGGCR